MPECSRWVIKASLEDDELTGETEGKIQTVQKMEESPADSWSLLCDFKGEERPWRCSSGTAVCFLSPSHSPAELLLGQAAVTQPGLP